MSAATLLPPDAPARASLRCPHCRGRLQHDEGGATCAACGRGYVRHHGILDLRVFPDPHLGLDEDRDRADRVAAALDSTALPDLLRHYWSLSETTPALLRAVFVRGALRAETRARMLLDRMEADGVPLARSRVLDVGSGTGAFLAEAYERVGEAVGLDIALRWLQVSRRRFLDRGQPAPALVCACAERLPFADGEFDLVVSTATLEFTRDADRVFAECARVLRPGGRMYLSTVNRFSLAPEPHVRLWGVGWLPRSWQAGYARWRGRGDFSRVRLLSRGELDACAARHFAGRRFEPPPVPDDLLPELSGRLRLGVRAYTTLRRWAPGRALLRQVGPEWDVMLSKS